MPGINDSPEQVEPILEMAEANGATSIGGIALHLRGEVRQIFFDWLRANRPDLIPLYERLYARGAYMPPAERERFSAMVRRGPRWKPPDDNEASRSLRRGIRVEPPAREPPPRKPRQEALF